MDISSVLTDILVVLVAAKVAAEVAQRIGVPAVVGEILAGAVIGPSALGLVGHGGEVLRTLGEIGVILLLLEVGMEMDLAELGKVGRASLLVAVGGVVAPMALGFGAMELLGQPQKPALFVAAALTATSVGITARVFGDLRALASTEARVVLGAAVADDVIGLVVLTVVVRLVTGGSVSALSVAGIVAVAVGFLVIGAVGGLRITRPLFAAVARLSRSTGTMVALALAFTLAFALAADAAKLAPIVGAFVAGIALTRSDQADRIRRELAPVGHLFVPVFFLQIGIDADIGAFASTTVLRDAGVLLVVAVAGKLVSSLGAAGTSADKALVGLGMLPRGEVGLIFATIGLTNGILGQDLYAALLLVVLLTTLATPQLLKLRHGQLHRAERTSTPGAAEAPPGGWLLRSGGEVDLAARPPDAASLPVALDAAVAVARAEPGDDLLRWLSELPAGALRWDPACHDQLLDVIERSSSRSWRLLETTGVLDAALPGVAAALRRRAGGRSALDPVGAYSFGGVERLRWLHADDPVGVEARRVLHPERLVLGLFLTEVLDAEPDPDVAAATIVGELRLDGPEADDVLALVRDRALLWAAATRAGAFDDPAVLSLATHLAVPDRARMLYVASALLQPDRAAWEQARLRTLHERVQGALAHDDLSEGAARDLVARRRHEVLTVVDGEAGGTAAHERVRGAPTAYVLQRSPEEIAGHLLLLDPPPGPLEVRVAVSERKTSGATCWAVDVVARDRPGLLAAVTGALAAAGLDVADALVATWPDGVALESFAVRSGAPPEPAVLGDAIRAALDAPLSSQPLAGATVSFDDAASPWHTVCEVLAPDVPGALHLIATALAAARVDVVAATLLTTAEGVDDRFEVVDRDGAKLDRTQQEAIRSLLECGVTSRRRLLRGPAFEPRPPFEAATAVHPEG